jgi:hypothetical protein
MSSQRRTRRPAVPALPPVHQRGGCVKKANYFLPGEFEPFGLLVVVGTIEQLVAMVLGTFPPFGLMVVVAFVQFKLPGEFEPFGLLGTGTGPGIDPPFWRLSLTADTTRGARRAMESLKNNISSFVKRVK